jgi:glycosyltransferase involved in cell wall biosynthesis
MTEYSGVPKVSVIVPVHDEAQSLQIAVASILGQSFGDLELLIVDDSSRQELGPILSLASQDPRVKVIPHEHNRGTAAARNTGIGHARGEYLAFLDSDDVWYREKLERQLAWMNSGKHAWPVSCTGYRIITPFHPEGQLRRPQPELRFRDLLWGCSVSPGSTMMAKRTLVGTIGLFDESLRRLEDWDWLLRCAQVTPIAVVPEVLAVVETGPREFCPLEKVREAATIIEGYVASDRYRLGRRQKKILLSTLHTEVAAAAFLRRRYGSAAGSFLKALYYRPIKRVDYYRRILWAVKSDLLHKS